LFERFAAFRHGAVVALYQHAASSNDVFGLGAVEADTFDKGFEARCAERQNRLRRICNLVEFARREIDAFVRCLCRQNDGNQQFERRAEFEFAFGFCIVGTKAAENFCAFGGIHRLLWNSTQ
jgi:hypothetical protein